MKDWLYNILKNGTLVDNQIYKAEQGLLRSNRLKEGISLRSKAAGKWANAQNDEPKIWQFLNKTNRIVKKLLEDNKQQSVVLFNEQEYEHNTDDDFIAVSGIDARNFELKTSNLIGQIKSGDYSLKISARFGDNFLKYIIADADGFLEIKDLGGNSSEEGYEWLLVYLWKTKLKKAFRLGLPKSYKSQTERLTKVRGTVDVIDYFIHQKRGSYLCSYREHSYLNDAAILISEVFKAWKAHGFLSDMHVIKNAFTTAAMGKKLPRKALLETPPFGNPFYHDYNEVIKLSKLLLRNENLDFGSQSDNSAFFFDLSMLFEYFIKKLLIRNGFLVRSKSTQPIRITTGTRWRKLEPDLVFETDRGLYVFDVKYKHFDWIDGVKREDLFQLHTYIGQYGNQNDIKGCGFIYPKKGGDNEFIVQEIEVMGKLIPFLVCFLAIPEKPEYQHFAESFQQRCLDFIHQFKQKAL